MANAQAVMDNPLKAIKAQDYNPSEASSRNTPPDSKDHVGHTHTETEEGLREGLDVTVENAEMIRKRCREKDAKEGVPYWVCPICQGNGREQFSTKGKCVKHITASHKSQVAVMKHEKAPAYMYTPIPRIRSPKRTLADLTTEKQAKMQRAAAETQAKFKPILARAQVGGTAQLTAQMVISQPESIAALRARKLDDDELQKLSRMAWTRGKRLLSRAVRRLCHERNIKQML